MILADLHIHSRFSRATSRDGDAPHLDLWARYKGLGIVGTGDFTHPAWRAELREALVPAEEGLYRLREDLRLPAEVEAQAPRFVVSGEISTIYKRGGRTRKVHHVLLLPGLDEAEALSQKLEAIGNLHSDGRPILGLDSHDLLEIVLETCPEAVYIPAHVWTPHFSLFGAFSDFSTLEECYGDLSGHIQENEQNDCDWTVILYQSMSGDSEVGNAVFNMTGGSLTSENGGLFYTTNTESTFYLNNVNITPSSNNEFFLKCTGNANKRGWGQSGANGADCSFTAENQKMEGDVVWDSISNLKFKMTEGSILTGGFIQDESCAGNGGSGTADLSIDAESTWIVTKDSRLSGLTNKGTIKDADGKAVTIKGSNGTVYVQGDSAYTVTVDSYTA